MLYQSTHRLYRWLPLTLVALLIACGPGSGGNPNAPTAVMRALLDLPSSSVFAPVVPAGFAPGGQLAMPVVAGSELPIPVVPTRVDQVDLPAVAGSFRESFEDLSLLPFPFGRYWEALRGLPRDRRVEAGEPVSVADAGAEPLGRLSVDREGSTLVVHWLLEPGPESDDASQRMLWRITPAAGGVQLEVWRSSAGGVRDTVRLDTTTGESVYAQLNPAAYQGVMGYLSILETHGGRLVNRARALTIAPRSIPDVWVVWGDADAGGAAVVGQDAFTEEIYAGPLGLLAGAAGDVQPRFSIGIDDVRYGREFHVGYWRPLKGLQIDAGVEVWQLPGGLLYLETAAPGNAGYGGYDPGVDVDIPVQSNEFAVPPTLAPRWIPILWGPIPAELSDRADVARVRAELLRLYEVAKADPTLDVAAYFVGAPDLMGMPEFERLGAPMSVGAP
jgi:hypothetical protein